MKKIPKIIYMTTIIINVIIILIFNNISTKNKTSNQIDATYNLEKINLMIDKIIERKIIEDTYFKYIDDELIENIKKYNMQTSELILGYTGYSIEILSTLYDIDDNELPQKIKDMSQRITKYALYKNATELIISDYEITQLISKDIGGSYGVWPWHIHWEGNIEMSTKEIESYFILIDELIEKLEIYKAEL